MELVSGDNENRDLDGAQYRLDSLAGFLRFREDWWSRVMADNAGKSSRIRNGSTVVSYRRCFLLVGLRNGESSAAIQCWHCIEQDRRRNEQAVNMNGIQ